MKRKLVSLMLIMTVSISVGACQSNKNQDKEAKTVATEKESETEKSNLDSSEALKDTQDVSESVSEKNTESSSTEETNTQEQEDKLKEDVFKIFQEISQVAPGTAGSSLKMQSAAGLVLDFCENNKEIKDKDSIKNLGMEWIDQEFEKNPEIRTDLQECWEEVKAYCNMIIEDTAKYSEEIKDSGYELEHGSYSRDLFDKVCEEIEKAYTE